MSAQITIGKNLVFYRNLNKMIQEDVAEYLGINRVELSYYETGTRNIPIEVLNKASDLYGIDLIDLLETDEQKIKANKVLAFRTDDFNVNNLESIAQFRKLVKNYLKMKSIEKSK